MPTSDQDMIALSFVMFTKHVNLGGETSKHLGSFGAAGQLELHPSGMVRVTKPSGIFWVGATCIESAEQREAQLSLTPAIELTEKADVAEALSATGAQKAEILREKAGKSARGGKSANSEPTMSRADEILAELSGK